MGAARPNFAKPYAMAVNGRSAAIRAAERRLGCRRTRAMSTSRAPTDTGAKPADQLHLSRPGWVYAKIIARTHPFFMPKFPT